MLNNPPKLRTPGPLLYNKTTSDKVLYELNPCGVEGPLGPDTQDCKDTYKNESDDVAVDVINGIQNVFIKEAAVYKIIGKCS